MQLSQLKWSWNRAAVLQDGGLQNSRYYPGLIYCGRAYGPLNAIAGHSGREKSVMPRVI
jgi:hypothetical protein